MRAGRTWQTYTQVMRWIAARYGEVHEPSPESCAHDLVLITTFAADLRAGRADLQALTTDLGVSGRYFRQHLRYVSGWGVIRRALLAGGANFQLLEGLADEERQGRLEGLSLSGSLPEQRRQLGVHLEGFRPVPQDVGWLPARLPDRPSPRLYATRDVAWVYSDRDVDFAEGLHPAVARSVIAHYLKAPGVVADPMAGSGAVALAATRLGHVAWASDLVPARPFIRHLDLRESDLVEVLESSPHPHVNLLFLHPPLPGTLRQYDAAFDGSEDSYVRWLEGIFDHTLHALREGGHLVLVLPLGVSISLLARVEAQLLASLEANFHPDHLALKGQHLAVARSGREGWHVLVAQSPRFADHERRLEEADA